MQISTPAPRRQLGHPAFWLVSVLVGCVSGLGAVVFRGLIGWFHNLFFLGKLSLAYNANLHTPPSPWGAGIVIVPVIGAIGVAFLVKTFAPEAKGHGVPEVMEAVYYQKGIIRPVVALVKALASALSIGSGGSVGREGPIIQIGSSFGSSLGQALRLPAWQRITLLAAGAGGGIAATFNTPLGGILFAAELLLPEVSARTLVPVAISTSLATYIGRWLLSANPSFMIPAFEQQNFRLTNPFVLLACVGLGGLLGIVSTVFIKSIYACEDFFEERVSRNYYVRHVLGMFAVGILIFTMHAAFGHYYLEGVGYAAVQDVLTGTLSTFSLLMLLLILKVVATSLTLGSGGSGGIFSPSLFLGATFGAAYGVLLNALFPSLSVSPAAFAAVGMAGAVGSVTGAAITAIVMIFEMTLDYHMILPMTITVAIGYGIRRFLLKDSIYTMKLARRGHPVPESLQANSWLVRQARDYMDDRVAVIPASASLASLASELAGPNAPRWFVLEDEGRLAGVIETAALPRLLQDGAPVSAREVARLDFEVVGELTAFFELLSRTAVGQSALLLVASREKSALAKDIRGIISRQQVTEIMIQAFAPSAD